MPVVTANISEYALGYITQWAKDNNIEEEKAVDEIISSVRRESERN